MSLHVNAIVVHDTSLLLLFQGIVFACGVNGCLYFWPQMNFGESKCAKLLSEKQFDQGFSKGEMVHKKNPLCLVLSLFVVFPG